MHAPLPSVSPNSKQPSRPAWFKFHYFCEYLNNHWAHRSNYWLNSSQSMESTASGYYLFFLRHILKYCYDFHIGLKWRHWSQIYHVDTVYLHGGMVSKLVNDLPTDWQCNIILWSSVAKTSYLWIQDTNIIVPTNTSGKTDWLQEKKKCHQQTRMLDQI